MRAAPGQDVAAQERLDALAADDVSVADSSALRIDGGTGNDTIKVNLSNAQTATFAYDVAIQGGSGDNNITFVGVNPGGHPTFGPGGAVFIDGGGGHVDVFGNFPVVVDNAQS